MTHGLGSIETSNYYGVKKPQDGEITTSAFAGRKEQSMDAALQANSVMVTAGISPQAATP